MDESLVTRSHTPGESGEQPDYLSYLMRLWRVRDGERTTWRASLESALTGEMHSFASLDRLCAFLRAQMEQTPETGDDKDDCPTTLILLIHRGARKKGGDPSS